MTYKNFRANDISYPLAMETIGDADIDALCDWLKTYPKLTKGDLTLEFEKQWAEYIGTRYAVFCNSGSSADLLMIYAAYASGKMKNKRIAVPSVGWVTTIAPAMQFGLEPIMIGADEKTFGMNLDQLEEVCRTDPPGAVIFVQVLGVPHYKERMLQLQEKYGFVLLEDSCAALGAEYSDGTMVGKLGDMSSFSFYFGHQLSSIEGGMVNTDSKELYNLMMMLRSHGWGKDLDREVYSDLIKKHNVDDFHKPFTFFVAGFNLRSTDLQAFLGIRQMEKAKWVAQRRYENHVRYAQNLKGHVEFQDWRDHKPVSISFGALARDKEHRKEIVNRLVENKIETRIFSAGNLGVHPFWVEKYGKFDDEMSNKIHSCGFFVPNYPELTNDDIDFICSIIRGDR
jgi:CDP-6-deoxy-D-xylo-4-hexulose-3-dehydrase|tara:strand:- start:268 stop:1458 length:1191 start_codon:yes stop_codon:yes gene_type:complete